MGGLYFLVWLFGVGWLFFWVVMSERKPSEKLDRAPFAMRDPEELFKRHGKRLPF